jgi:hypothetical protein
VTEVSNVEFPQLLDPVDDLPPQTIVTSVEKRGDKLLVRGVVADNGEVKRVTINGVNAKLATNGLDWEAEVSKAEKLVAVSEDAAGNVEKLPHEFAP